MGIILNRLLCWLEAIYLGSNNKQMSEHANDVLCKEINSLRQILNMVPGLA